MDKTGKTFYFTSYENDIKTGEINFHYRLETDKETFDFTERLIGPIADPGLIPAGLLDHVLDSLHLALGISYWKLYCPEEIKVGNISLTKQQADFWNEVYTKGLGEFFYKNKIDFRGLINFPYSNDSTEEAVSFQRKNRSLVGVGGGKDSIVTGELLKKSQKEFVGFSLNPKDLQENIIKKMGIESVSIKRVLDPQIFQLNKRGDVYNGHVPISAIYAFTALFAALLADYKYIIVSNEKSANYGNVEYLGNMVNHQWSKSEEFEMLVRNYIKDYITPDIIYFSLLRPYHEIKIAQIFSGFSQYFSDFSSCNKNFRINEDSDNLWCGECAKCLFVFASLAAFIPKGELIKIFGKNLFENESLAEKYQELLGVKDHKPFDCVGTPEEVKLAFFLAHKREGYEEDPIMKVFLTTFSNEFASIEESEKNLLAATSKDTIPPDFKSLIE